MSTPRVYVPVGRSCQYYGEVRVYTVSAETAKRLRPWLAAHGITLKRRAANPRLGEPAQWLAKLDTVAGSIAGLTRSQIGELVEQWQKTMNEVAAAPATSKKPTTTE